MACKKKIIITKFTNPHLFWFAYQSNDLASTRETIEKKILEHIATIPKLEQGYTPKIGQMVALNLRCGTESKWVRAEVDKVISKGEYAEDDFVCWLTDYGYSILSNSHYLQYLSKEIIEIPNDIIHMAGIENIIPIKKIINIRNPFETISFTCKTWQIGSIVTLQEYLNNAEDVLFSTNPDDKSTHKFGKLWFKMYVNESHKYEEASDILIKKEHAQQSASFETEMKNLDTLITGRWEDHKGNLDFQFNEYKPNYETKLNTGKCLPLQKKLDLWSYFNRKYKDDDAEISSYTEEEDPAKKVEELLSYCGDRQIEPEEEISEDELNYYNSDHNDEGIDVQSFTKKLKYPSDVDDVRKSPNTVSPGKKGLNLINHSEASGSHKCSEIQIEDEANNIEAAELSESEESKVASEPEFMKAIRLRRMNEFFNRDEFTPPSCSRDPSQYFNIGRKMFNFQKDENNNTSRYTSDSSHHYNTEDLSGRLFNRLRGTPHGPMSSNWRGNNDNPRVPSPVVDYPDRLTDLRYAEANLSSSSSSSSSEDIILRNPDDIRSVHSASEAFDTGSVCSSVPTWCRGRPDLKVKKKQEVVEDEPLPPISSDTVPWNELLADIRNNPRESTPEGQITVPSGYSLTELQQTMHREFRALRSKGDAAKRIEREYKLKSKYFDY